MSLFQEKERFVSSRAKRPLKNVSSTCLSYRWFSDPRRGRLLAVLVVARLGVGSGFRGACCSADSLAAGFSSACRGDPCAAGSPVGSDSALSVLLKISINEMLPISGMYFWRSEVMDFLATCSPLR